LDAQNGASSEYAIMKLARNCGPVGRFLSEWVVRRVRSGPYTSRFAEQAAFNATRAAVRYHTRTLIWQVFCRIQNLGLQGNFPSGVPAILNLDRLPDFCRHPKPPQEIPTKVILFGNIHGRGLFFQ
jgi:hypothetical protein